ncbi:MAG: MBL fold metallo-hydrolase [Gammaproteobacteria bacterium]|nr:MBL fold metallo-hydrolase [Gammaproteobacteria bacterium]
MLSNTKPARSKELAKFYCNIKHHGAVDGVTGSCHQLQVSHSNNRLTDSYLVDCGLFQGAETSGRSVSDLLAIEFDLTDVRALVVTHCHIDHVGRIPYLLAAGFTGPIYCSSATALLLPEVIRDALKVGGMAGKRIGSRILKRLSSQLVGVDYGVWQPLPALPSGNERTNIRAANKRTSEVKVKLKFKPAGHILGSAYVEFDVAGGSTKERIVFSGDLGACYTPLLPAPFPPYGCDTLVIESTYGDRNHQGRKQRRAQLEQVLTRCLRDKGVVLIPAFSIGRTQELLYEIEQILFRLESKANKAANLKGAGLTKAQSILNNVDVIVDSPLAAKFTEHYKGLKHCWDKEARRKVHAGRHPLSFEQLTTINSHQQHLQTMDYLAQRKLPAIIIAASGMCSGGRIVNYLKRFIEQPTTDVLFVGYQARGTLGRAIIKYGAGEQNQNNNKSGYIEIDQQRYNIGATIHQLSGYSAHADQHDLLRFVRRMRRKPKVIKIVHGDQHAKVALQQALEQLVPDCVVEVAS